MKIIISPAKKMIHDCAYQMEMSKPVLMSETKKLHKHLKSLRLHELQELLNCNEQIAKLNYERYQTMDLDKMESPALLSYDGIQYKYMAPHIFEESYYEYVNKHLRILSGFYGILKPMDTVACYRLEMQAKLKIDSCKHLYDFWQDKIYQELIKDECEILNLASHEYSKVIDKYLNKKIRYVTCIFGELMDGKVKEKGVYVKMARGEMVRYMAENKIQKIEEIKSFNRLGFHYQEALSSEFEYVYIRI